MLKKPIKYIDFNGNEVEDIYYFNLSKPELIELEVDFEGGFQAMLERIIETNDGQKLIKYFKDLVLRSVGEKSDDGKRFVKNDEIRTNFEQSAAYEVLFMELSTNEAVAAEFIKGVLPKDLSEAVDQDKPQGPPPAPFQTWTYPTEKIEKL